MQTKNNLQQDLEHFSPIAQKQPWQMTRKEIRHALIPPVNVTFKSTRGNFMVTFAEGTEYFQTIGQAINRVDTEHKRWIKHALSQGKPVPRNVLEEYESEKWAQKALKQKD